jgi:tetratricopeptide (TPR) repeat protein
LFQAGRTLQREGDFKAAQAEYEKAQAIDSAYADLAFCIGQCWLALGKIQEARALLIQARDLDTLRFRADSTINQMVRQEAKALAGQGAGLLDLEASLEQDNQGFPLGDTFLVDHVHLNARGNFRIAWAAMQAIRQALPQAHLNPPNRSEDELYEGCRQRMLYDVHEQYRLASVMYYRKTRPPFTGQLDHDTELASLRQALVQLRSTVKQNAEAESSYVEALKRAPSDTFLVRRYGDFLLQNQRVTEAVNAYQRGIEGHPFDPSLRTGLAEALASGGARDKAVAVLTARDTPFPDTPSEALQRVGGLYVKQGRYAEALSVYQDLHRIDSRDVHTLVNMASAASHTGDLDGAKQALDRALSMDPDSVPALINMGNYYVKQGQTQEAHAWFERAAKADPYNYIPQFSLGLQKLKLGQIRDGLKHVTESVNLKPDFVQGYETLATAYAQFEKAETARQYRVLKDLFSP